MKNEELVELRPVEDILKHNPTLNIICALYYGVEDALFTDLEDKPDDYGIYTVYGKWNSLVGSLKEAAWADGKHTGDCTNTPITCNRCLVEDSISEVYKFLEGINLEQEQQEE